MRKWLSTCSLVLLALAWTGEAHAYSTFATAGTSRVPNAVTMGCLTCHNNASGGSGCATPPCWNAFGTAFNANGQTWNAALAALDSDGDGWTNGEELLDPTGVWPDGGADPGPTSQARLPGYSYTWCATYARACSLNECTLDYDDCDTSPVATCNELTPYFSCTCPTGYSGSGHGSGGCTNIDECSGGNPCNENIVGSGNACFDASPRYNCSCGTGYALANDGTYSETCNDVNECTTGNPCNESVVGNTCTNTTGRWDCSCGAAGYTLTGNGTFSETCSDVNECTSGNPCNEDVPGSTNSCSNLVPRYDCTCGAGYTLTNNGTFSETCADVNECSTMPGVCGVGTCVNATGSYSCTCPSGYTFNGTTCANVNECVTMPGVCGVGSCMDVAGSYTCSCPVGYSFDGTTCAVTNACNANLDDCDPNATCTPIGTTGWSCACLPGYSGNGRTPPPVTDTGCTDVNECPGAPCGVGACFNTPGGYSCSCPTGYTFDGTTCVDVNECTSMPPCGVGTCTNRVGSYSCTCPAGYSAPSSGGTCADVDECLSSGTCNAGAGWGSCTNSIGGYDCTCNPGYGPTGTGLSLTCANVDECTVAPPCGVGTCTDTTGSYRCTCPPGYAAPASGGSCTDVDECALPSLCGGTLGYGSCVNTVGAFDCSCNPGFVASGTGAALTCVNVDECAAGTDDCDPNATCTDSVAAFGAPRWLCTCNAGWEGPGNTCTDFDECSDPAANDCSPVATCVNQVGTYGCDCNDGYEGNGFSCADVDDCGTMPCGTNEICQNEIGAPRSCLCEPGSVRDMAGVCVSACGNGLRVLGEACDDGNDRDGDGCSSTCDVELGWSCFEATETSASTCAYTCGDGVLDPLSGEECDEGIENDDAAADACRERCLRASCGDGTLDTGEECDTGDLRSGRRADACRMDCRSAFCGDGVLDADEYCDDGTGTALPAGTCTAGCFGDSGVPAIDGGVGDAGGPPAVVGSCACRLSPRPASPIGLVAVLGLLLRLWRRRGA